MYYKTEDKRNNHRVFDWEHAVIICEVISSVVPPPTDSILPTPYWICGIISGVGFLLTPGRISANQRRICFCVDGR